MGVPAVASAAGALAVSLVVLVLTSSLQPTLAGAVALPGGDSMSATCTSGYTVDTSSPTQP
jgi:hypothetical protein